MAGSSLARANYKILPPDPIALPPQGAFSTPALAFDRSFGHDRPRAKAALECSRQLTCRTRAPKTRHQCEPVMPTGTATFRESFDGRCIYL
jgi:hypothetical protein